MGFFDTEHKTKAHILEIILIIGAIGLTGAKSLIIIAYQLVTEHARKFKRFYSRKACLILNTLEVAFWGAVIYMSQMSTGAMCPLDKDLNTSCIFGWTVIALAVAICVMSAYAAILSFREWRQPRPTTDDRKFENLSDTDDVQPLRPVAPRPYPSTEYNNQYNNPHSDHYYYAQNSRQ